MLQVDTSALLFVTIASLSVTFGLLLKEWFNRPVRPLLVNGGSVIGEYMERYCQRTGTKLEEIVLVSYEIDEKQTVYRIEPVDMYPEVWLGE